jgi:non-specific serine/threonine protein kinase
VSNLEFYKKWSIENKIDFVNSLAQPHKMNARIKSKISRTRTCYIVFHFLKAGGVGLNITKASYVFLFGPWWNPLPKSKVLAAHRIGQLNKVNVVRFITKKHRRGKIIRLQENKKTFGCTADENHISPEIEENLDFILV